jgi:hypothetical protein
MNLVSQERIHTRLLPSPPIPTEGIEKVQQIFQIDKEGLLTDEGG